MTNSLATIFKAIALTETEREIRQQIMPQIGEYFAAKRCQLFLIDRLPAKVSGLFKLAISPHHNPVLRYIMENHAPVHEGILVSPSQWQRICPRFDHGHVIAGPIVADGKVVGGLGMTRDRFTQAFNRQDIVNLSALCLHLSTHLAKIKSQKTKLSLTNTRLITPREAEIAELVALGFTNAEIGKNLWITENSVKQALKRIYRKLNVSSRAAMVARLAKLKM